MLSIIIILIFMAMAGFVFWDAHKNDDGPSDWKSDM